jgi:predicted GIY-YIG superfamily endonuclease
LTNDLEQDMPYVYMLKCNDGTYYVGQTLDIELRLAQHQAGTYGGYTAVRRPVQLMWHQRVQTDDEAFKLERRLKKWSQAKKEALIASDFERLHDIVTDERKRKESNRTIGL